MQSQEGVGGSSAEQASGAAACLAVSCTGGMTVSLGGGGHSQQTLMGWRNWVKGRAQQRRRREAGEEGAHVWFLFCDREQRRNWHLGERLGLSSIHNKFSSISSPQPVHRLPRLPCLMLMEGHNLHSWDQPQLHQPGSPGRICYGGQGVLGQWPTLIT